MKWFKPSTEKSSLKGKNGGERVTSDRGRKCGSCGENGHYHSTCPKN